MLAALSGVARRAAGSRPVRSVVSAPFTHAYLVVLLTSTLLLRHVSSRVAERLLAASSTDVAHLSRDPARVLVTSALWLPGRFWLPYALVFLLVLAPLERRFGVGRAVLVFLSGHVLATLLTELPIAAAIALHWLGPASAHRLDVGVSYGTFAAVGAFAGSLSNRRAAAVLLAAVVTIVVPAGLAPGMTTYGHLLALTVGTAWWPRLYRRRAGFWPASQRRPRTARPVPGFARRRHLSAALARARTGVGGPSRCQTPEEGGT